MTLRRTIVSVLLFFILTLILVSYMNSWKQRKIYRDLEKGVTVYQQDPDDFDQLYNLDEEIIYTDKDDYQLAIGYHNDIFKNGLKATVAVENAVMPPSVEEVPRPTDYYQEMTTNDKEDNARNNNTKSPSSSDEEESIDQNSVTEEYQSEVNGKVRPTVCSLDAPRKNVILIKTHRTGSSTLGNILYRYGDIRNLSFVLPNAKTFQYYWPLRFHASHTRTDLLNRGKPNMAVNIGRFNKRQISPMMCNDSFMITILRDPINHFESVYEYADISKLIGLWNKTRDPFGTFLEAPRYNVTDFVRNSTPYTIELNMLKNGMAFDLGLEQKSFSNEEEITEFIETINKSFNLVLIAEHFDESLVLMKRLLCWDSEDVIYVKHKVRNSFFKNNITGKQKEKIQNLNKADVLLYDHFNKSLWDKIEQQGDSFFQEVEDFRAKVAQIKTVCFKDITEGTSKEVFEIPILMRESIPSELKQICNKLKFREKEYVRILKDKQKQVVKQLSLELINNFYVKDRNDSKIYYEFKNRTNFNLKRNVK